VRKGQLAAATDGAVYRNQYQAQLTPGVVSVPLSTPWGKARHTLRPRRLAEDIAENNLINGADHLQVGITRAWYDLREAYQQTGLATETQAQARRPGPGPPPSQVVEARVNFRMRLSNYKYLTTNAP
jgi:outer membrane protein TolC